MFDWIVDSVEPIRGSIGTCSASFTVDSTWQEVGNEGNMQIFETLPVLFNIADSILGFFVLFVCEEFDIVYGFALLLSFFRRFSCF